jgi:[acyl-carrier-protein] S-malonyltransferase
MANAIATLRVMEKDGGKSLQDLCGYVAGHSLGEYSALCAAGALNLTTTAELLKLRGLSMQKAVPVGEGGMAALLGADIKKASALANASAQGEICTVANDNDPTQVVISGHIGAIERAIAAVKDHDIKRGILLPVSAPFHCSLMAPAAEAMEEALAEATILPPVVPVFANVTAAPVSDVDEIRDLLVQQVTGTVRWRESVAHMAESGVEQFVEFGGKVLTGMVGRIAPGAETVRLVSLDDIERFLKEL